MSSGRATVKLDLMYEIDDDEFNRETGNPEDALIDPRDIQNAIHEQIEEAVRESGNGSSIGLSFGDENTEVRVIPDS